MLKKKSLTTKMTRRIVNVDFCDAAAIFFFTNPPTHYIKAGSKSIAGPAGV